jgi:YVTN family beta-propeller protein
MKTKTAGKVGIAIFGAGLIAVCVALAVLAIPGTPNSTRSLQFQGYIPLRLLRRISVAEGPGAIIYDPYDKLMYVTNGDAKVATLIDPVNSTNVAVVPLGGEPEFAVLDPQTNLIYQNLKGNNTVAAVDVARHSVVQRWPLPGCDMPTGAAIDAADRRLFVVCAKTARLLALDLVTHQVVASLPIGGLPDSVAYDPELHRIYTTGLAGIMSVVQQDAPNTYRLLDTVHLHYGAHTLAIDPVTHRVYAAYANLFVQPRLAVFSAVR